ncbi:polyprotein [Phytophthora megakarya]|uniref:Polyprotein n=1 Tax=Phytophthora megakarya TaxID=4795 RepID=A0A225VVI3_9STRA|nr:polyprotein [Phytophthora megakarya]
MKSTGQPTTRNYLYQVGWRHYLYGVEFDVFTDNNAYKWFLSHPNVSVSSNVVADALSRVERSRSSSGRQHYDPVDKVLAVVPADPRSNLLVHTCTPNCRRSEDYTAKVMVLGELSIRDLGLLCDSTAFSGGEAAQARPIEVPEAVTTIHASHLTVVNVPLDKATKRQFLRGYRRDPLYKNSIKASTPTTHELAEIGTIRKLDGLLFVVFPEERVLRLCVPISRELRTALIAEAHDGPVAAHAGTRRTQQKLALWYFWPSLAIDVKTYMQSCSTCIRFKSSSLRKTVCNAAASPS